MEIRLVSYSRTTSTLSQEDPCRDQTTLSHSHPYNIDMYIDIDIDIGFKPTVCGETTLDFESTLLATISGKAIHGHYVLTSQPIGCEA